MSTPTLSQAVQALAARCDYAHADDGQGFNAYDAPFGHDMAAQPEATWTPKQRAAVYRMVRKYRGQLAAMGIEFDAIPEPPDPSEAAEQESDEESPPERTVGLDDPGERFVVEFPYDSDLVAAIRDVPGRRYSDRLNYVPTEPASARALNEFIQRFSFHVEPAAAERLDALVDAAQDLPPARSVVVGEDSVLEIRFPKDDALIREVKKIPGASWNQSALCWHAPISEDSLGMARDFAARHGLEVSGEVEAAASDVQQRARRLEALSEAVDGALDVPGLDGDLYPFQAAGVRYALETRRCWIADQMGLGKTIQALAAVQAAEAYPAVVLCPASLKLNWAREARTWLPDGKKIEVLEGMEAGRAARYRAADVLIVNYDILAFEETKNSIRAREIYHERKERAKEEGRRAPKRPKTEYDFSKPVEHLSRLIDVRPAALILDESHYVKNPKAIRTKAAEALAATDPEFILLLTGTPLLNRPSELISQLRIMGRLDEFGGWYYYARRYCNAYKGRWGWDLSGAAHLDELNYRLRSRCYVRRTKDQVLKDLPAKQRAIVPVEIDNVDEYLETERDAAQWFADRAAEDDEFLASIADLEPDEQADAIAERRDEAEFRARKAEVLTRIAALKQVAARGKIKAAKGWIRDFLDSGEKLVVFAHHKAVVRALSKEFDAPMISGDTAAADRQAAVDRFQNDPDCRLIVGNMRAMGVGLTLTAASDAAFLEIGWTPGDHDQAEDRCHRIGQDDSVTAWYLLARVERPGSEEDQTIDDDAWDLVLSKRDTVDAATEGEERAKDRAIVARMVDRITRRAG